MVASFAKHSYTAYFMIYLQKKKCRAVGHSALKFSAFNFVMWYANNSLLFSTPFLTIPYMGIWVHTEPQLCVDLGPRNPVLLQVPRPSPLHRKHVSSHCNL